LQGCLKTSGKCKTSLASTEPGSRFALRGISMVPVALFLIPFLTVTLRRFVFTGMGREWLDGEIDALRPRQNGLLEQGLYLLTKGETVAAGA
jgi:hypothetical protein